MQGGMRSVHILLVEDNEGDILLTKEAFDDLELPSRISVAKDGKEAIDFLTREGKHADAKLPDLLLLDINLPKKNGIEVLRFIKNSEDLKHIPVIILTTSSSERDIIESYKNYVNCYITKPVEVENFLNVVSKVGDLWISTAKLPFQNKF